MRRHAAERITALLYCRMMPARVRILLKIVIFALVIAAVTYPDPRILLRHWGHVRDMNAMIDPAAPELARLERDYRLWREREAQRAPPREDVEDADVRPPAASAADDGLAGPRRRGTSREALRSVERFIYATVQYDWDWNVWGVADYMPSVAELFRRAALDPDGRLREDCDGRAVLAASLLRRLGFDARLVTDFGHVWVQTHDAGRRPVDLMGKGRARGVVSSAEGNRFVPTWSALANAPLALAYGLSVFPWKRELIVFVALMLLLAHPRMSRRAAAEGAALSLAGWQFMRFPVNYWAGEAWFFWLGLIYLLAGCTILFLAARRARAAARAA